MTERKLTDMKAYCPHGYSQHLDCPQCDEPKPVPRAPGMRITKLGLNEILSRMSADEAANRIMTQPKMEAALKEIEELAAKLENTDKVGIGKTLDQQHAAAIRRALAKLDRGAVTMTNTPRIYNLWAGNPKGVKEDRSRCVKEVCNPRSGISQQCKRSRGHGPCGLYCKQHAKKFSR